MNVYLFERLFNLGNNYARMRSCRVEGHSQIDLKGLKNDKIRDHIAGDSARGRSKPRKVGSTIIKILHHWFVSNRVLGSVTKSLGDTRGQIFTKSGRI